MVLWGYPHPPCEVKDSDGHATYFSDLLFLKSRPTFTPELISISTVSSLSLVHSGPQGPQSTPWDSQTLWRKVEVLRWGVGPPVHGMSR